MHIGPLPPLRQKSKDCPRPHLILCPQIEGTVIVKKNLTIAVAPEILVPQQLLGLPFGESVMAECLVEVGIMQSFKVHPISKSG